MCNKIIYSDFFLFYRTCNNRRSVFRTQTRNMMASDQDSDPEIYPVDIPDNEEESQEQQQQQEETKETTITITIKPSAEPDSVVSLFLMWVVVCFLVGAVGLLTHPHLVFREQDLLGRFVVSGVGLFMFGLLLLWTLGIGAVALLPAVYVGLAFLPELFALVHDAI